ncbi:signal recognition particle-docking protein FtsY [Candidatus Mycoplasma haematohominis]|uniref:signal recognition particle-docking protein FtsY n=1 Tax=Candidatus Mycoplasma haematohominis TaxID=1494318 RepID=UPI001C0A6FB4|nr:signal recognition particle-docking protein FtsY [Candidatus Mycoplasma haemohominis]
MKWNIFKRNKNLLVKELKKQNKQLSIDSKEEGIFAKSAAFFKQLLRTVKFDDNLKNQIEEILIRLDFGPFVSEKLSKEIAIRLEKESKSNIAVDVLRKIFKEELLKFYGDFEVDLNVEPGRTNLILVVGSNGSGKTTSIAKLAYRFKEQGFKILIVAADTFRAGAVEQLNNWAIKLGVDITLPSRPKEDPSALIYKSLEANKEKKYDLIICDTSGKQHNNQNLLQELNKVYKTIRKFDESYPNETLLIIDSTTGQTSLLQAKSFLDSSYVTGIILSKMDNTTRGGIIFAIKEKFKVPVKLVGTGEELFDLIQFDLSEIVDEWTENMSLGE